MIPRVILVSGGRNYADEDAVDSTMSAVIGDTPKDNVIVIHGNARGADKLVDAWCKRNHIHTAKVDALWDSWPMSAGPKRNSIMLLLQPDTFVAFPGGRGTKDMVEKVRKAQGINMVVIE